MPRYSSLGEAARSSIHLLKQYGREVDTGHWQGVSTAGKPDLVTKELMNLTFEVPMSLSGDELANDVRPSEPWAENHFQERVSRVPSNPGEQYLNWPWWRGQEGAFTYDDGYSIKFTHTYQERFWPKRAPQEIYEKYAPHDGTNAHTIRGIRYPYGDLDDLVGLLRREPFTRQATLPIFFPEDTGAVHGGRIPCTLHYHFLRRGDQLNLWYPIRSCDAGRHFRDDLYMAVRLCQWVLNELKGGDDPLGQPSPPLGEDSQGDAASWLDVEPGMLHFTAYSFHVHMGDYHLL